MHKNGSYSTAKAQVTQPIRASPVAMNVAEFLDLLLLTERHEIVEASLPDMDTVALPQFALPRIPALAPQDAPCESLFEHLHDRGLRAAFRLGDQQ